MELDKEFVETQKLSDEQVTAINDVVKGHYDPHIAELKKGWDSKANDDAEGILNGAATKVTETTKVTRGQGEKIADFMERAFDTYATSGKEALETAKKEYEAKVEDFQGDANLKADIINLKEKLDPLQKKEAEFDTMIGSGYKEKYDKLYIEHASSLESVAFGSVKPQFHKDANEFEVGHKWNAFIKETKEKHNIVMVDNEPIAIDKDNEHKRIPLKEIVAANEGLKELMQGRQQPGIDANQTDFKDVEGLPFKLPVGADSATITKLIQEHLKQEGVEKMSDAYSEKFAELNRKARAA